MSMNEMGSKIRELRQLQALIDEATAETKAIRDAIKADMTAQGAEEMRAGEYRVTWNDFYLRCWRCVWRWFYCRGRPWRSIPGKSD